MTLAFSAFIMQLLGFPAPLIYGAVIDSTCLVVQTSCSRTGACLLYDQDQFRLRLHGMPALAKICALCMYSVALYMSVRRDRAMAREAAGKALADRIAENNNAKNAQELKAIGDGEMAEEETVMLKHSNV